MKTKISPIDREKTIDYGNELLQNFWLLSPNEDGLKNHKQKLFEILDEVQEGVVCLQTQFLTHKSLIEKIFNVAQRPNVWFYILVEDYSQELKLLQGNCLIRYDLKCSGSFILLNPNTNNSKGVFFTGQFSEDEINNTEHFSKNIEKDEEIESLFSHFCFQFWENAKKEVVEKEVVNVVSKPIDVFHDVNAFEGKDFVYGTLFKFSVNTFRKELSEKKIIHKGKEANIPAFIKPNYIQSLGDYQVDRLYDEHDFKKQEPNLKDDNISIKITYQWKNLPFYLPEEAVRSSLYNRWEQKNEEIKKQLDSVLMKIEQAEKNESIISKDITRLFLGKKTVFSTLKSEIYKAKEIDFSNETLYDLKVKINRINEINSEILSHIAEIEIENSKAKLDEEIKKLKVEKSEYQNEKNKLEFKKQEMEAESQSKEIDDRNQRQFINKCEDDIKNIDRKIKYLQNQIKNKEQEKKNKQITQNETESSLEEFIVTKKDMYSNFKKELIQFPNDLQQLPQVGELFLVDSHPYLAIKYWEDYEAAEKEAERLKAKLCAIKE